MYWISKSIHWLSRARRRGLILLAVLGPGIITMVADNDAGGISTYAQTGAKTGFTLLWAFIILVPMAYYVQEMTVRLGAVTKRGHAEAIFDAFGPFWGWFSIFDLAVINWLTLVTEYIGMTQAMRIFGVPEAVTFVAVTLLMFGIVVSGRYWTFEKLTLFFCLFNLVYIPAAFWAMKTGNVAEGWAAVGRGFYWPDWRMGGAITVGALITLIMANIGTTITPWQIFFQQSAVVDKGMDVRDIRFGKIDTFFGSLLTCVVAAFIVIATAGAFFHNPDNPAPEVVAADKEAKRPTEGPWQSVDPELHTWQDLDSAAKTAQAMPAVMPTKHWGDWAKTLFAIGLFDAGLLGALCISLATSWALGEVFGWAHSLNKSVREAPWFYAAYVLMLLSAGVVTLVASVEVQNKITIFVQVVAVTLLPAALMFLILLLNDVPLMGKYVNTRWQNIANWAIVVFVIAMSTVYAISVLFSEAEQGDTMVTSPDSPLKHPDPAGKDFRFLFFSELLARPVCTGKIKDRIGKLTDLVFRTSEPFPEAAGIYLEHGWGKPTEFIAWDRVVKIDADAIFVQPPPGGGPFPPFVDQPGWIMLNEHLMGKTILDMDGRRTEVVNDVHLLESKGRMIIAHVDISMNGFLRKWGLGRLRLLRDRFISWRYVQPLSLEDAVASDTVSLSIARSQIAELPSEDLADALEELSGKEQEAVFSALDSEKAAETLLEAEPRAQRQIIANLRKERARTILGEMSVPQLASLFSVLPHDDKMELLAMLPAEQSRRIETILSEREATAGALMSSGCVTMAKETRVGEALGHLRSSNLDHDMVSYVYVVGEPAKVLLGVVDLRELVLARDDATLGDLMCFPVVAAETDDVREDLEEVSPKYHYRMIPVVDRGDHLQGVIHYKDIMKGLVARAAV